MFNSFINNIPLVKEVFNVILNQSLGFNLDMNQITIDNGIQLSFNNIDLQPYKLNQILFSGENNGIKLRITKISLKSFSLCLSPNEFYINIKGINIVIMPFCNQSSIPKKPSQTPPINEPIRNNNAQPQKQQRFIDSILTYILSRIIVQIEDISVHLLNYETTQNNMLYANPCLTIKTKKAYYTKGICDAEKEITTIWGNKMISIEDINVMIEKNYRENLDSDSFDLNGRDNSVIFTIENSKGIKAYSNYNNDITIELGISQIIMNPLQIELLRNIGMTYIELFKSDSTKENRNQLENENQKRTENVHYLFDIENNTIKFKCEGISIVLLENNYRSDLPKYYLFKSNEHQLSHHFCYFEDNYFLIPMVKLNASYEKKTLKVTMNSFKIIYIEYNNKTINKLSQIKEEEIVIVNNDIYESVYEDAKTSIENSNNNDCYHSVYESSNIYLEKQIKNYIFHYNLYIILNIDDTLIQMDNSLLISIKSLTIAIHPIYMFKYLKACYSNAILLNEILLFNFNCQENQSNSWRNNYIPEDNQEIDHININDELNSNTNNHFINNNIHLKEKNIKHNTQSIDLKLSIKEIDVTIQAFKREKDFETIATPYLAEFYYDAIYLMNKKYNSKKSLDISLITSNNILSLQFKDILFQHNSMQTHLQIVSFETSFNNKLLLHSSKQWNIFYLNSIIDFNHLKHFNEESRCSLQKNEKAIIVNCSTSLSFTLSVWQLKDMMTFIEVWSLTNSVFNIFMNQMRINHNKIRSDIDSKYSFNLKDMINNRKEIEESVSTDDIPIFIAINLETISLNIKTYYDTDSLISSLDTFEMILFLSNNISTIDFYMSLKQIKSRKLFSSDQIEFYFNLKHKEELKPLKRQIQMIQKEIHPEQDFEYFIFKSKSLLKETTPISKNQNIYFKILINNIHFQPLNLLSLFTAVLPQIQRNKSLLKQKNNAQNHFNAIVDDKNSTISNVSSSNLINYSPNRNNNTDINFDIKIKNITFDYTQSQISLIISLKDTNLSPTAAFLNEFKIDMRKEISDNSKQSLMNTLASISDVKFARSDLGNVDLDIGRIDIKFCKDSFWCFTGIITYMSGNIIAKVNNITQLIFLNTDNDDINKNNASSFNWNNKSNINLENSSLISFNSNFICPLIQLDIDDDYLLNAQVTKYYEISSAEDYIKGNKELKKSMKINLILGDVFVTLFQGKDLESQIDYNSTKVDYICSEESEDEFILVQANQFAIKSRREINDYIMLSLHHLNLKSEIELDTMNYALISVLLLNIEIFDNLTSSNFKRLLAKQDIDSKQSMISASIVLSNSLNSLSVSHYCDYEIIANCCILPLSICIDQSTLSFIISFFTLNEETTTHTHLNISDCNQSSPEKEKEIKDEQEKGKEPFIINPPPQEIKKSFFHLSHHSQIKKEKHIFIKKLLFDEINIDISFNYLTFSTSSNNITIPILGVEQFPLTIHEIKLKGYYLPNDLAFILSNNLLNQLINSKFKLLYQGIKSFNLTKPFTNFVEKLVQLFTTPYYSYKDNKGLFQGLVKGVKNFIMNIILLNFLYGEKTVKTLTAFIGVSKSNQITKQSFYNKYILDDQQQKVNDYFYKG